MGRPKTEIKAERISISSEFKLDILKIKYPTYSDPSIRKLAKEISPTELTRIIRELIHSVSTLQNLLKLGASGLPKPIVEDTIEIADTSADVDDNSRFENLSADDFDM